MSDNQVIAILAAFESARSGKEYRRAKLMAADLDPIGQLAMVDTARAARARLLAAGLMTPDEVRP